MLIAGTCVAMAQKVDYKSGTINVDGKDVAKVIRIKDKGSFGLTASYELDNMAGNKLVIATMATDFAPSRNDGDGYYYRFTFLSTGQVAIFGLSKFGPEKAFAKLLGESGVVINDQLDVSKVNELIALKSKNPKAQIEYNLVNRNYGMNVMIKENQILQGLDQIGVFKDITPNGADQDAYEFSLPSGLVVAKTTFKAGKGGVKNCIITTNKDGVTRMVDISEGGTYGESMVRSEGVDRHQETIKKIAKWLVKNQYL
ncbi:hypothetical protein SAMN05192574_118125 [Mucilaginibacter gossypiicola]|uniref:Uncharacterized protein n=2 Tax=Mucilaginibacter gossypiicola TaxID=551995 RepID=A0A1H8UAF2_9SPHI|nr:hypothetical protein SAMN05192574_118125 [Mucilaginibacter gossypiicola]